MPLRDTMSKGKGELPPGSPCHRGGANLKRQGIHLCVQNDVPQCRFPKALHALQKDALLGVHRCCFDCGCSKKTSVKLIDKIDLRRTVVLFIWKPIDEEFRCRIERGLERRPQLSWCRDAARCEGPAQRSQSAPTRVDVVLSFSAPQSRLTEGHA